MRVLLARPPRRDARDVGLSVPPLGLAYLAGALRAAGRPVEILDAAVLGWSWPRFEAELARRRPDVLGLSAMTPVRDLAFRAAALARPHVRHLVLGGPHATAVGATVFEECAALDAAVEGEGEDSLVELLAFWEGGGRGDPPPGVRLPGRPFVPRTPRVPVESLAWPARDLLPMGAYRYLFATRPRIATMITSRGCPFRCSFCDKSVSGSRWRARPADDVAAEMAHLVAAHGVGFVNLYDDNFTLHRGRVEAICEALLRRGLDLHWKCEGRVDGVDLPLLRLMKRAGCRMVAYGVESGNAATLARLRKDITVEETRAAFAAMREAGIPSLAYMILGAPGEGEDEVRRSLRFCQEIGASYVQFSTLSAMPGTEVAAAHPGAGEDPHHADVRNPVDGDLRRPTVSDLPPAALDRLMREAWLGFYLRPRPAARVLRDAWRSGALHEAARLSGAMGRWALRRSSPATTP